MELKHKPVLLQECLENLNIKPDGIYVDATVGGAGHSAEIWKKLGKDGVLMGIDRDSYALEEARKHLEAVNGQGKLILVNANFKDIENICFHNNVDSVDGILFDLGVSSYQLDEGERGFSYQYDAPLDMRMDRTQKLDAKTIVNEYTEGEIREIIFKYGEEKWAGRIAAFIVKARKQKKIETTGELVDIIKAAIPSSARRKGPHPGRRTFQALRIAVNNELEALDKAIDEAIRLLKPGGRLCIITFHSLEDRIVKNKFIAKAKPCICPPEFPACRCGKRAEVEIITKKPILPSQEEIEENPRARSSKLRVLQKTC